MDDVLDTVQLLTISSFLGVNDETRYNLYSAPSKDSNHEVSGPDFLLFLGSLGRFKS